MTYKRKVLIFFATIFLIIFLGCLSVVTVIIYYSLELPKISTLSDYRPAIPAQILAKDGTVLAEIGKENRDVTQLDDMPVKIIDAFLSAEDDSFYSHKGVDYEGILRAMIVNLKSGRVVQGGSTITQQVAKTFLLSGERSYKRKIMDILLAQKIEKRFSKKEILFLYLNQIYLGGGFYGVKAASKGYFGKELEDLSFAEAAMIAGLLVAPGRYSPYINPKYANQRQRYVLSRLEKNGKITSEQYAESLKEKIRYRIRLKKKFKAGYFTDWIRQRVIKLVGKDQFLQNGFRIQTTLDWELQQLAEKLIKKGMKNIDKRQGYKGVLNTININEDLEKTEIQFRNDLLKKDSTYFTLNDNLERIYEFVFNEEEFKDIKEERIKRKKELLDRRFIPGIYQKDTFLDHLKTEESYQAVVLKSDDRSRVVYISIGGVIGIIPYENFRWAHERIISDTRPNFTYIIRPSSILKPGDIILAQILKKSVSINRYFYKYYRSRYKNKEALKNIKKEKYLLCMLDQEPDAQGGLVSISPDSGEIISFVGGYDFETNQFNRAIQSKRQPGSSFKPILYAAALENNFTLSTKILDSPESLGGVDESINWKPRNYDGKFLGPMTFRTALEKSRNVPTIKIAHQIGVRKILDFTERIGFNAKLDNDLSLSLGSFGVSLADIVATYAIFPNKGKIVDLKSIISITDRDGNLYVLNENVRTNQIIEREKIKEEMEKEENDLKKDLVETDNTEKESTPEEKENPYFAMLGGNQVYDERLSYIMCNLLKGIIQNPGGTGGWAREVSQFIGGKTGTTNNYVDAWFIGFSTNIVTGVWTGFDNNKTLGWGETGAKSALPIWKEFMRASLRKYGEFDFQAPEGIVNVKIDKKSGEIQDDPNLNTYTEVYVEGTEPGSEINEKITSEDIEKTNAKEIFEDDYYKNQ